MNVQAVSAPYNAEELTQLRTWLDSVVDEGSIFGREAMRRLIATIDFGTDRVEWARLKGIEDLTKLLVEGHLSGFPVGAEEAFEADLINRLDAMLEEGSR